MSSTTFNTTVTTYLISSGGAAQGSSTELHAGNLFLGGNDSKLRSLLRFDVSDIVLGSTIDTATLTLPRVDCVLSSTPQTFNCYRLTQTGWTEAGATWSSYDGTSNWASAGGDYTVTAGASTVMSSAASTLTFSIVNLVQDAIDSRSGILNIIIVGPETPGASYYYIAGSDDHGTAAMRPTLAVTYTQSIFYEVLQEAKSIIEDLDLHDSPPVTIRKIVTDRNTSGGITVAGKVDLPGIIIAPFQQQIISAPGRGVIQSDDIMYSIVVLMLAPDDKEGTIQANLDRTLMWRQQILRAFHLQEMSNLSTVYNCMVSPMEPINREGWSIGYQASFLMINFVSREART